MKINTLIDCTLRLPRWSHAARLHQKADCNRCISGHGVGRVVGASGCKTGFAGSLPS